MHKGAFILAVIGIALLAVSVILTFSPSAKASVDSLAGSAAVVDISPSSGPVPLVTTVTCYAGSGNVYPPDYFTLAFGDGTTQTVGPVDSGVVSLTHVYNSAGVYSVVCTVYDANNDVSKGSASVSVLLGSTTVTQTTTSQITSVSTTTVTTTYTVSQSVTTTVSGSVTTVSGTTFVTTQTVTHTVTQIQSNPIIANLNLVFASLGIVFVGAGIIVEKA